MTHQGVTEPGGDKPSAPTSVTPEQRNCLFPGRQQFAPHEIIEDKVIEPRGDKSSAPTSVTPGSAWTPTGRQEAATAARPPLAPIDA